MNRQHRDARTNRELLLPYALPYLLYVLPGYGLAYTGSREAIYAMRLLLAGSARRIFWAVTGFTLAHSITLSLSALGVLVVPVAPVEAVIALSILFLAREIAVGRPQSLANRYPLLVSSSFGLLHGLGFAAALSEIGLQSDELVTSLFSFNLGVEVGQILVILPVLFVAWLAGRGSVARHFPALGRVRPALPTVCAYAIGVPASFWFLDRVIPLIQ